MVLSTPRILATFLQIQAGPFDNVDEMWFSVQWAISTSLPWESAEIDASPVRERRWQGSLTPLGTHEKMVTTLAAFTRTPDGYLTRNHCHRSDRVSN